MRRVLHFPLVFAMTGCLDAPFGTKGTANVTHQITRAVEETMSNAGEKAGGDPAAQADSPTSATAGDLALALGEEIVVELGASLRDSGLTESQAAFIAGRARDSMQTAAGNIAIGLGLKANGDPTQQELLAVIGPAVLEGAMGALDEDGAELGDSAARAAVTGTVMTSSMVSLGAHSAGVEGDGLQTLMQDLTLAAVSTLPAAGLGDADMAAGAMAIQQGFASSLINAGISADAAPAFVAIVVSASVQRITTLVSEDLLADIVGAATEGAVAGVNVSGINLDTQGGDAAAQISAAVVVAVRDVATSAVALAVTQTVVQGAVKASAENGSTSGNLGATIAQIAKDTLVALSNGAKDADLAVNASSLVAEGAVKGVGKSNLSAATIVSGGLLEGAVQGAMSGLVAAGKSASAITEAASAIIAKTVAAVSSVGAASEGNKVTLVGALVQSTVTQLGSAGVTNATSMGTAIAAISKAATVAANQIGFSADNLTSAASGILSGSVAGIGKAGFSSSSDVQALAAEAVKGTISGFTSITNAATAAASTLATSVAAITASGINALSNYTGSLTQEDLTTISAKFVGTAIETVASGGIATSSLSTITTAIKADATTALSATIGVASTTVFDATITSATATATLITSGQTQSCASDYADSLSDTELLSLVAKTNSALCLRQSSAACPKRREFVDPTKGEAIAIQWNGGFADPLLCSAAIYGMAPILQTSSDEVAGSTTDQEQAYDGSDGYYDGYDGGIAGPPPSQDGAMVVSVYSTPSSAFLSPGSIVDIYVAFSEPVSVVGTPFLEIYVGYQALAEYSGHPTPSELRFTYTVAEGDETFDLDYTYDHPLFVDNNGQIMPAEIGTIMTVRTGMPADLTFPSPGGIGSLSFNSDLSIDTVAPHVVGIATSLSSGSYTTGMTVPIYVYWSEPLVVTSSGDSPYITVNATNSAIYATSITDDIWMFEYVIQASDLIGDLAVTSINPGGFSISDAVGHTADMSLPPSFDQFTDNLTIAINTGATLGTFSITGPLGSITDTEPVISWTPASGAASYNVIIASSSTCSSGVVFAPAPIVGTSIQASTLGIADYFVCVIANDGSGGSQSASNSGASFAVTSSGWTTVSSTGAPSARIGHAAAWLPTSSVMALWGGFDGSTELDSGALYDPTVDAWTTIAPTGAPAQRRKHTAVALDSSLIVWGGEQAGMERGDGGIFNASTSVWTSISMTGAPAGRFDHTAILDDTGLMIVWGGEDFATAFNSGAVFDPNTNSWVGNVDTSDPDTPTPRTSHTAVWSDTTSEMIIWGGRSLPSSTALGSGSRYDVVGQTWVSVSPTGAPSARWGHVAIWLPGPGKMLIWGGTSDGTDALDDGALYDPASDSWELIMMAPLPMRHALATHIAATGNVAVYGGNDGAFNSNELMVYDVIADDWSLQASAMAPTPAGGGTMVFGPPSQIITFGGYDGTDYLQGARYTLPAAPAPP